MSCRNDITTCRQANVAQGKTADPITNLLLTWGTCAADATMMPAVTVASLGAAPSPLLSASASGEAAGTAAGELALEAVSCCDVSVSVC